MKIGPSPDSMLPPVQSTRSGPAAAVAGNAQPGPKAAPATPASTVSLYGPGSAGVSISKSAGARALEQTDTSGDINHAKVQSMRDAIANGTFKVNAEAIADKLLANAQEMLDRAARR